MNPLDPIEEAIFSAASALTSSPQRAAFLDQACGANVALRQRIEALLQADLRADQFFAADPLELGAETAEQTARPETPLTEAAGTRVGRYKLLQKIGEGGMGVVYMAEQEEPVRRRVALKIIKLGMDTRQVIARFEAERQALALMDHPNIARVFDGGATETGRPYFVMELVQGVPITEFCDKNRLPAKERLKLFITVCQAIQSAHQKGIIHRDIKPSNVLVTLHDGVPVPKVIDFGIAKATHQKLTEKTLFTQFASMIGTPAYMSPEQAEMTGLDTDTRTDIYALGVLLYALLTGTTPFPEKRLRSLGYGEMQRVIMEEEPERPSTRLSTMENEQKTIIARNCGEELASLSHLLKGDLDWIVMKCLEKDRQRRYDTANGLAADVQRYLGNEPVIARPPSAGYRFKKLIRRNRTVALATATVALALIFAAAFSTTAFLAERRARLLAAEAERARETARQATTVETIRADTVAKFVTGFFDAVFPELVQRGHRDAIRQMLQVADTLAASLSNAPLAEADIRFSIGGGYAGVLYDFPSSEPQFARAEYCGSLAGIAGERISRLALSHRTGSLMWGNQDTNATRALRDIANQALGQKPPNTELAAQALSNLALFQSYFDRDHPTAGEATALEVLKIAPDDWLHLPYRTVALDVAMRMLVLRHEFAEADKLASQLIATLPRPRGSDGYQKGGIINTFVKTISAGGRLAEAEATVQDLARSLPKHDTLSFDILTAFQGDLVARGGDWVRGLALLSSSATNVVCPVDLWSETVCLAALLNKRELHRALITTGLIRWAAGADTENVPKLVEPLLAVSPDANLLPVIRELVDRSQMGSPWTRNHGQQLMALLAYRTGQYADAARAIDDFHQVAPEMLLKGGVEPVVASGWFTRALIEARLGRLDAARDAYREGQKLHSPALRHPGNPYSGDYFESACAAELLRREAAALLGDATPPDAPAATKP